MQLRRQAEHLRSESNREPEQDFGSLDCIRNVRSVSIFSMGVILCRRVSLVSIFQQRESSEQENISRPQNRAGSGGSNKELLWRQMVGALP